MIAIVDRTTTVQFEGRIYKDTNLSLRKGINVVGLPANIPDISTLEDFERVLGKNLKTLIAQNNIGKFVSSLETPDLKVKGDDAFIIIARNNTILNLHGSLWQKQ